MADKKPSKNPYAEWDKPQNIRHVTIEKADNQPRIEGIKLVEPKNDKNTIKLVKDKNQK